MTSREEIIAYDIKGQPGRGHKMSEEHYKNRKAANIRIWYDDPKNKEEHKEKMRVYMKNYYQENKSKRVEYCEKNKEKRQESMKAYYQKNKDKRNAYMRFYKEWVKFRSIGEDIFQ